MLNRDSIFNWLTVLKSYNCTWAHLEHNLHVVPQDGLVPPPPAGTGGVGRRNATAAVGRGTLEAERPGDDISPEWDPRGERETKRLKGICGSPDG